MASSSEIMIKAEGKCSPKGSHLTGRFERPNSLNPIDLIQHHPDFSHLKRLWVPHRKHGRRKKERLQMGLRGPTHRKHGRWKPDPTVMPSLPLQLKTNGARRWCCQRKRSRWKSVNRYRDDACDLRETPSTDHLSIYLDKLIFKH